MREALRRRVEDWAAAVRAKDIDAVMSIYAPDVVSFDLDPPLRYAGADRKRRAWQQAFARYCGSIGYEVHELEVSVQGEIAFVHSVNHVSGTLVDGHATDMWMRWTACFRSLHGIWLVVHDHASLPADLAHGRAALDLTP